MSDPVSNTPQPIGSPKRAYDAALAALSELRPMSVLDCPAGQGAFTELLRQRGYATSASDILPHQFKLSGIDCSYCDLNDRIEVATGTFDAVTCLNGLHRVWARGRALRELARVLKPGGHLVLTFVNNTNLSHRMAFMTSGSAIHNTLGPPHVNFPEEEQPAAVFRYPMTIGDVLSGLRSVNLKVRTIDAVGTSKASLALLPAALVPMLGRWLLPKPYHDHCSLPEANSLRVLLGDYLLVVAEKPSNG